MSNKKQYDILIVDDCREDYELYQRLISTFSNKKNSRIIMANSGAQGLEYCKQKKPKCILLDYQLPDMNGLEFLDELREIEKKHKFAIVMLTGQGDESIAVESMKKGVSDYLIKSRLDSELLRSSIDNAIKQRNSLIDLEKTRCLERALAYHDVLTGLPNRQLFLDRLTHALNQAKRYNRKLALLNLDLNGFKLINDNYGHDMGDLLLQAVAKRLTDCIRDCDTVARLGGDEYTIILENIVQIKDVAKVAKSILKSISNPFVLLEKTVDLSISVGISLFPNDGLDGKTLAKRADVAMYRAKNGTSNRYIFYSTNIHDSAPYELQMEEHLKNAIENNELLLHFQPQIDVKRGKIIGAEALVRWNHPERGLLPPADFISLAEETGLIVPLGQWVLRAACGQMQSWQQAGFTDIRLSVNLSPRQFRVLHIKESIVSLLQEFNLDPNDLTLEITETCAMQNVDYTLETLNSLKNIGVRLAIDDFGTGYASLSYLKRFPIDLIKIDRTFVKGIHEDRDDWAIVSTIISLAQKMYIKVLAEGVENKNQLLYMQSLSCDEIQGFYYSKPLPGNEFTSFMANWDKRLQQNGSTDGVIPISYLKSSN